MNIDKNEFYYYLYSLIGIPCNDDTLIFEDFGIAGLDCDTFMISVFEKYNIDHSNYNHDLYYADDSVFGGIWDRLRNKQERFPENSFTALHLYHVATKGEWFAPE